MTITSPITARHIAPPAPGAHHVRTAVLVGVAALILRLVTITRSYELFIDEITYTGVSRNLARGHGLSLFGHPFTLHPPALFGIDAIVIDLFGIHGSTDHVVLSLRPVDAVFGALVCVGAYLLVERAAGWRAGVVAGLLLALDPFAISYDSLVMLEAPAGAAAIAVFGLAAAAAQTTVAGRRRTYVGLSGLMTAIVLTTKDTFGLVAVGALLVLLASGWVLRRREVLSILALGAAGYVVYLMALAAIGDLGSWWSSNLEDFLRLIGARQTTGFNAPSVHVSLVSRSLADLSGTASSYVVLALGPIAAVVLLYSARPWRSDWSRRATPRLRASVALAVWTAVAAAYLVYATLFGSIEEQMYYILLSPALCSIAVAAATVRRPPIGSSPAPPTNGHRRSTSGSAAVDARRAAPRRHVVSAGVYRSPTRTSYTPVHRRQRGSEVAVASVLAVVLAPVAPVLARDPSARRPGEHYRRPRPSTRVQWSAPPSPPARRSSLRQAAAALAAVALIYNGVVWYSVHTTASDGYTQLLAWASKHIPKGSTGSVTDGSAQFLLTGFTLGDWDTLPELQFNRVLWVVVSVRLTVQGYTPSTAFLDFLERHATLLYEDHMPIGLRVYSVGALTGVK